MADARQNYDDSSRELEKLGEFQNLTFANCSTKVSHLVNASNIKTAFQCQNEFLDRSSLGLERGLMLVAHYNVGKNLLMEHMLDQAAFKCTAE